VLFTGYNNDGKAVFLRDIWPSREEIEVVLLQFSLFCGFLLLTFSISSFMLFLIYTRYIVDVFILVSDIY